MMRHETIDVLYDLIRLVEEDKLTSLAISAISNPENRTLIHTDTYEPSTLADVYQMLGVIEVTALDVKEHILRTIRKDDEVAPDES
jgi:hypothetical protein